MPVTKTSSRDFNQDASRAESRPVFITDRSRPSHIWSRWGSIKGLLEGEEQSERGRCPLITGLGAVVLRYWTAWPRRGRIHWSIVYEKSVNAGTKRQEWLICIEPFPDI
jgi:hypothetical protein